MTGVEVRLPAVLADVAGLAPGERTVRVQVPAGGTVGAVLDAVTAGRPRLDRRVRDETGALRRYVNVYVGDEDIRALGGLAAPVGDGDVVSVLPSVAGG